MRDLNVLILFYWKIITRKLYGNILLAPVSTTVYKLPHVIKEERIGTFRFS